LLFFFPFVWSLYLHGIIVETEACEFQFMLCPRQHTRTFVSRSYSFFNLSCIFELFFSNILHAQHCSCSLFMATRLTYTAIYILDLQEEE
jgi:hypothetical protein